MSPIFQQIFSSTWSVIVIILLFGGSIFIHELGHFLAAKKRGLHIDRFSIGFGPKICSWVRDGIEYRISWIPFGGYVSLPQLADMKGIEGDSSIATNELPSISYASKLIVAVMGAVFNVLFALALGVIIWVFGYPTSSVDNSTQIGFIQDTITTENGIEVISPAKKGGLQLGDEILEIDGSSINSWSQVTQILPLSTGTENDGQRLVKVLIRRDGKEMDFKINPVISSQTKMRHLGIGPASPIIISALFKDANSPAALAGLKVDDRLLKVDGQTLYSPAQFRDYLEKNAGKATRLQIDRSGDVFDANLQIANVAITTNGDKIATIGIKGFSREQVIFHPNPIDQINQHLRSTIRTLYALVHPKSDVGIKHMSGPPGIARILHFTAQVDIRLALWVTVLININLAVLNLLPIPVLDGGHILFATISKLRNKPLPINFIASIQGTFMILLFGLMIYVSGNDVARMVGNGDSGPKVEYIEPVFPAPAQQESPAK